MMSIMILLEELDNRVQTGVECQTGLKPQSGVFASLFYCCNFYTSVTPEKFKYVRKSLDIVYATREQAFKNPKKIPEHVFDTIVQEYDIVIHEYSDALDDVDMDYQEIYPK